MAKKTRSLNPADAFRKAQRQKEIKRNKLDRKKAREGAQNKNDSSAIQAENNSLESSQVIIDPATGLPAASDHASRHHTEHNNSHNPNTSRPTNLYSAHRRTMNWFGPDGKLLEPEKSFYYDPVFNPFGVPPPGMPVRMKDGLDLQPPPPARTSDLEHSGADHGNTPIGSSLQKAPPSPSSDPGRVSEKEQDLDDESDESQTGEEETEDAEEDDIPLPEGSPPEARSDDDTDDNILLPDGPPPPPPATVSKPPPQLFVERPQNVIMANTRNQTPLPHPSVTQSWPFFPPSITLVPGVPPPPIVAGLGAMPFPLGPNGLPLPPPPITKFHSLPPPPPSAKLPAKPHITNTPYGATPNPTVAPNPKPVAQASATVTALPQLRDLKREATSFVPAAIRKKRKELDRRAGLAGLGDSHRIHAAPEAFNDPHNNPSSLTPDPQDPSHSKPPQLLTTSLLATLKRDGVLSDPPPLSKASMGVASTEKDDYDKFVESLGDVL